MFKSPIVAGLVGALAGFLAAKFLASSNGAPASVTGMGIRNYPFDPGNNYFGKNKSMAIMTALNGPRRLGGSGPQIPPFVNVDPKWSRSPSMFYPEGSPNFIGRDHWWSPRTAFSQPT